MHNIMFYNIFIHIKQIRSQTTQTTIIIFILNIFNFWCMRIKSMHLFILFITNWNMKHIFLNQRHLFYTTVPRIPFLLSWNPSWSSYLQEQTIFTHSAWPSSLNFVIFRLDSDFFHLVLSFFIDDLSFYSVLFFLSGLLLNWYNYVYFNIHYLWKLSIFKTNLLDVFLEIMWNELSNI